MLNDKIIYLAGIIDGEGSISIEIQNANTVSRKTDYYSIRLVVINTCKPLLDWIVDNFGGKISTRKSYINRKQCYNWTLLSHKASDLLKRCIPYMIVKKQRAQIIVDFMKTKEVGWYVSEEVQNIRRDLYAQMKSLNKLGE